MKYIKIMPIILSLFLIPFMVSGCWNYEEVHEIWIATGIAIDRNKETDKYMITVETIKPLGGQELKMLSDFITFEGETIFDAIRNIIAKSGKKLYWSHAKILIASEEVAREGIVPILDFITRDAEVRSDIWLLVSKEKTAKSILEAKHKMYDTVSFHLDEILKSEKNLSKFHAVEAWHFLNDLSTDGISAVLPTANLVKKNSGVSPQAYGTAVFKKDKMIGWINGIETQSMLFVKGKLKGGLIVVENVADTTTDVALEIFKSHTKVKPISSGDNVIMKIDVKTDVGIAEITGETDFISKEGRTKLKAEAEKLVKKQIEQLIKKVQKEFKSDIFGFGNTLQRAEPDVWRKLQPDWEDIFSDLETQVNVEITISGSALTSKPIKVGD